MKKLAIILIFAAITPALFPEAVATKAYKKRSEVLTYLRALEPIVKNFRGNDRDGNPALYHAEPGKEGIRVVRYNELKNLYQEGMMYLYEESYVNSYRRFLEAQLGMEQMLEEISQLYVERTEEMLKASIEKKNPNDPNDRNLVDISVEYTGKSRATDKFLGKRESPFTRRMYDAKEFHYVTNRYAIEKNIELGYRFLGLAKKARIDALRIENNLMKHQKL